MARAKVKRKTRRRSRKTSRQYPKTKFKGILFTLFLLTFLVFSLAVLGYFIFFRTVIAAELETDIVRDIIFEEPSQPVGFMPEASERGDIKNPKCAIIIDDMGYHKEVGKGLMDLPLNLTFSFLPHAPYTEELEEMAYQANRTIMLHLPLEPQDSAWDPGPGALYIGDMENMNNIFHGDLHMVPHATGVNNHMGSLYTEDRIAMGALLGLILKEKLFFIDSYTSGKSVGLEIAREFGVDSARRHLFLDNNLSVDKICAQLRDLVTIAKTKGSAIGIAHPHMETLQALRECGGILRSSVMLVGVEQLLL